MILAFDQASGALVYDAYATLKQGINSYVLKALSEIDWEGEEKQADIASRVQAYIKKNLKPDKEPAIGTITNNIRKIINNQVPIIRELDKCTISSESKREGSSPVAYLKLENHGLDISMF